MPRLGARGYGVAGLIGVALLLGSAAIALPTGAQPAAAVADFYATHRAGVLLAQLALVAGSLVIFVYASGLGGYAVRAATPDTWTGVRVAAVLGVIAAVIDALPAVILALIARSAPGGGAPGGWIGRWSRVHDLTGALLFLAIAFWCFMAVVETRRMPSWMRWLAGAASVAALVRAGLGAGAVGSALDVIAPGAFAVVVVLTSLWLLWRARPESAAPAPGS